MQRLDETSELKVTGSGEKARDSLRRASVAGQAVLAFKQAGRRAATLKRLPFRIRLESMSARATRVLLYATYLTLLVAVVLTATDKLNFDKVRVLCVCWVLASMSVSVLDVFCVCLTPVVCLALG